MYIDPGSGTLLWQVVLSGVFGLMFYFRNFVRRLFSRNMDGKNRSGRL